MSQFDHVSVIKKANVYFDGKCVSHTVVLADGTRKSVGVILPATLTFNTGAPEVMELLGGRCRVRLAGELTVPRFDVHHFKQPTGPARHRSVIDIRSRSAIGDDCRSLRSS